MSVKKNKKYLLGIGFGVAALIFGVVTGVVFSMFRDLPQIRLLETYTPPAITRVYSSDQVLLAELFKEKRRIIPLERIPANLQKALIATEDRQFYEHSGIDIKGIARALIQDIIAGEFAQGASTITQQLAKTLFLTPEKSIARKLKEAILALQLERRYTKDEILEFYLNEVYLGSGAYGVESAARIYFAKPVDALDLAECALIAALPKAPSAFSPLVNPELAVKRRNIVLKQMQETGIIDAQQYRTAAGAPYLSAARPKKRTKAPYFMDYVKKILEKEVGAARVYKGGLNVYTTLCFELQEYADAAVEKGICELTERMKQNSIPEPDPQSALIALNIRTGGILAMAGGVDFDKSPFNRAVSARRQPGSAFKPIVYAHAVEQGFHQAMLLQDTPAAFPGSKRNDQWCPENFSKTYQGAMTLRKALTISQNIPAVRLIEKLGPSGVVAFAGDLGIGSRLAPNFSLALGTSEVTLMELTSAYAVFANRGRFIQPFAITAIEDADHHQIWKPAVEKRIAMTAEGAAITTDMLKGVVQEGTGRKAKCIRHPIAGKTGTTNQFRDALFVGFSPSIAAGVWVGCDDFSPLGPDQTGARAALPIWIEFMSNAVTDSPYEFFDFPDNLVRVRIDPENGKPVADEVSGVLALFRKENAPE